MVILQVHPCNVHDVVLQVHPCNVHDVILQVHPCNVHDVILQVHPIMFTLIMPSMPKLYLCHVYDCVFVYIKLG